MSVFQNIILLNTIKLKRNRSLLFFLTFSIIMLISGYLGYIYYYNTDPFTDLINYVLVVNSNLSSLSDNLSDLSSLSDDNFIIKADLWDTLLIITFNLNFLWDMLLSALSFLYDMLLSALSFLCDMILAKLSNIHSKLSSFISAHWSSFKLFNIKSNFSDINSIIKSNFSGINSIIKSNFSDLLSKLPILWDILLSKLSNIYSKLSNLSYLDIFIIICSELCNYIERFFLDNICKVINIINDIAKLCYNDFSWSGLITIIYNHTIIPDILNIISKIQDLLDRFNNSSDNGSAGLIAVGGHTLTHDVFINIEIETAIIFLELLLGITILYTGGKKRVYSEEYKEKLSKRRKEKWANRTQEEIDLDKAKRQKQWANRTQEQIDIDRAKKKKQWANRTEEQRIARNERAQEKKELSNLEKTDLINEKGKNTYNLKKNNNTQEEIAIYNEKQRLIDIELSNLKKRELAIDLEAKKLALSYKDSVNKGDGISDIHRDNLAKHFCEHELSKKKVESLWDKFVKEK